METHVMEGEVGGVRRGTSIGSLHCEGECRLPILVPSLPLPAALGTEPRARQALCFCGIPLVQSPFPSLCILSQALTKLPRLA